MKYLSGYPQPLIDQARILLEAGQLGDLLQRKYPEPHQVGDDRALYRYVQELKTRCLRNAAPLALVSYDNRLHPVQHALGMHISHSTQQGARLKNRNEIRIATLFRDAPAAFLRMIVVHELAHLRHKEHDKPFYQLCRHMEPDYFQLEFDLRLYLTWREQQGLRHAAP